MLRKQIYKTKTWKDIRKYIWLEQHCLCARCNKPVYVSGISDYIPIDKRVKGIVHHKIYLDDNNYIDEEIAFNKDNLEGLCIDCHNNEHFSKGIVRSDLMFDEYGNIVPR